MARGLSLFLVFQELALLEGKQEISVGEQKKSLF